MKKITALFLTVILMMTVLITPVFAVEADEQRTTIGADLTQEQVAKIYEDFGIEKGSVKEITVTNADERAYLEGLVDERKIGYVALSCTYIKTLKEGEGTDITIMNINWCTEEMYKNALQTAGITDAVVKITAPKPVSGTAALTGIYKAYEDITGEKLNENAKETAAQSRHHWKSRESIGSDEATQLVNELKKILDQTKDMTDEELRQQIVSIAQSINVTLTDEQIQQLIDLVRSLEKLDISGLTDTINSVGDWFKSVGEAISDFFKSIGEWFASLFS
ncbi:MAG: DUF1002 domain-containing protein [Lachnospiraceae bacterium]